MRYTVYLLRSLRTGRYYVGQTCDIQYRMFRHNVWLSNSYTSKHRPWQLVVEIEFDSRSVAMQVEKYLKKKPRAFLKRMEEEKELRKYVEDRFSAG